MNSSPPLPVFYLYGEPHRSVDPAFVHIESLDDRTRPSEWTIHIHTHAELNHIFHVASGGGRLLAEDSEIDFAAPCLLIVPAGTAHGFQWQNESSGAVITLANAHLRGLYERDPALRTAFHGAAAIPLTTLDAATAQARIGHLMREHGWAHPGHRAAIDAGLLDLMVLALRGLAPGNARDEPSPGPHAALVAHLRQEIEERFRLREPIVVYARSLNVSLYQLRTACAQIARASPSEMVDQRAMLEARRALLYSNLSVAEVAFSLGFSDAAYFSRFFSRHTGCSPRAFRQRQIPGHPS